MKDGQTDRDKTPGQLSSDSAGRGESADGSSPSEVGVSVDELAGLYVLSSLKHFGPMKFKTLWDAGVRPAAVLEAPGSLPIGGKRGEGFRRDLESVESATIERCRAMAERQLESARRLDGRILTYGHRSYPPVLLRSKYPVPYLFVRGSGDVLRERLTVACVGSRTIRPPFNELHARFTKTAVTAGFVVISGFALGADTIGHRAAVEADGATVCVMPGGLDRSFPPENKDLWQRLLSYERAAFVSEMGYGTQASSLLLRKRNKLIVALSLGVLVSQSSAKGGAMNAYRFAVEERKPVATFEPDGTDDTTGNQVIASDERTGRTALRIAGGAEGYRQWLQKLSYST